VRVFDDLSGAQGEGGPDRVISPTDGEAAIGVNLHGIVYDAATDNLLVTDVGDAASAEDGQIFVIPAGSSVDGSVEVSVFIGGDGTRLGNPVDIAFDGVDAYVAEKSNSRVLRYDAIFDLSGAQNVAEDASFELENPESVQLQSE
jgi:DNA-binding beta-propeller fold protein YncE